MTKATFLWSIALFLNLALLFVMIWERYDLAGKFDIAERTYYLAPDVPENIPGETQEEKEAWLITRLEDEGFFFPADYASFSHGTAGKFTMVHVRKYQWEFEDWLDRTYGKDNWQGVEDRHRQMTQQIAGRWFGLVEDITWRPTDEPPHELRSFRETAVLFGAVEPEGGRAMAFQYAGPAWPMVVVATIPLIILILVLWKVGMRALRGPQGRKLARKK